MSKISQTFTIFFSLKNSKKGDQVLLMKYFHNFDFQTYSYVLEFLQCIRIDYGFLGYNLLCCGSHYWSDIHTCSFSQAVPQHAVLTVCVAQLQLSFVKKRLSKWRICCCFEMVSLEVLTQEYYCTGGALWARIALNVKKKNSTHSKCYGF